MSVETELQTTSRYYRFIRSWTMTDPVHAKVELVTNAIDALQVHKSKQLALGNSVHNAVYVEEDLQNRTLTVRDFATGLSAEKMQNALLVIGAHTADSDESRGTFSSGAKNVSQLGKVSWHSIKDGKFSSCYITMAGTGAVVDIDVPVTAEHRSLLAFDQLAPEETSGTTVILQYSDHLKIQRAERTLTRFLNYFSMRDVLSNDDVVVRARFRNPSANHPSNDLIQSTKISSPDSIHSIPLPLPNAYPVDGELSDWFDLSYKMPENGVLVERFGYVVPEYPEAKAYFELYQLPPHSPLKIPDIYEEDTLQFGFTIASSNAVHEHSCFWPELRTNEDMRFFYGRLRCDYIDKLLKDYDLNGPTSDNPVSIVDPSRLYGLNRSHKFVQWMLSVPDQLVRLKLREMRDAFDKRNGVASEDVLDLVGKLRDVGESVFDVHDMEMEWRNNARGRLRKAVADNEEKFVFVRDVAMKPVYSKNPNLLRPQPNVKTTFVFSNDEVVRRVESEAFPVDAQTNRPLKSIHIDAVGELVAIPDDVDLETDEHEHDVVLTKSVEIDIVYSDSDQMRKRFRTMVVDNLIRITININSPCFFNKLSLNGETGKVEGLELVKPVLIETLVQAFSRIYVDRKIQSATERNVVHINNAAAAPESKYAEELDEATVFIEKAIYRQLGQSLDISSLDTIE